MIHVTVHKKDGRYVDFRCKGHAGFARENRDIICSAVSVLVINTVNSLEAFTKDAVRTREDDGYVFLEFPSEQSPEARLLMDSLLLGLGMIEDSYGSRYLKVDVREVT